MNIRYLANMVARIKPGQWITVSDSVLVECAPPMRLLGFAGPEWTSPEMVMENIIGSAYEFQFHRNPETGHVTFERLKEPLKDERRTYVSPDRRPRYQLGNDGYYHPNL